jgi:hypothetical protein
LGWALGGGYPVGAADVIWPLHASPGLESLGFGTGFTSEDPTSSIYRFSLTTHLGRKIPQTILEAAR